MEIAGLDKKEYLYLIKYHVGKSFCLLRLVALTWNSERTIVNYKHISSYYSCCHKLSIRRTRRLDFKPGLLENYKGFKIEQETAGL